MVDERLTWFPFDPARFLTDRHVAMMHPEHVGAYWKLVCHLWIHGPIPDDPERLAPLVGVTTEVMADLWRRIRPAFTERAEEDGGGLILEWLEEIREEQQERMDQRRKAGRKGAKSRWGKGSRRGGGANASPNGTAMAPPMEPHGENAGGDLSFSLSMEPESTRKEAVERAIQGSAAALDEEFTAWWREYPRRLGNNPKAEAEKLYRRHRAAGVTREVMFTAVRAYRAQCEALEKIGTELVMRATTWLGTARGWEQEWDLPRGNTARTDRPAGPATTDVRPGFTR